jgi:hypothetical protein
MYGAPSILTGNRHWAADQTAKTDSPIAADRTEDACWCRHSWDRWNIIAPVDGSVGFGEGGPQRSQPKAGAGHVSSVNKNAAGVKACRIYF